VGAAGQGGGHAGSGGVTVGGTGGASLTGVGGGAGVLSSGGAGGGAGAGAAGTSGTAGQPDGGTASDLEVIGAPCAEPIDCASGVCANGVCCSSPCEGDCLSCALPGSVGVCAPRPASTICLAAQCNGNMSVHAVRCDGKGACLIPLMPEYLCSPFACDAATGTCRTTCASDADCFNSRCVNGACGFFGEVASCSSNAECASGFCAGGVCCNVACEGGCVSCALPDRSGVCTPVEAGNLDPRGVCKDQGVASCGTNGRCDGQGACGHYPANALCAPATCVGSTLTSPRFCDGSGTCLPPSQSVSCAPLMCRADVAQCAAADNCPGGDAICVAGAYCSGNEVCALRKAAGAPCDSDHECVSRSCVATDGGPSVCGP
jgi:hypothetical protein